jgi:hypothetical protein
MIGLLVNRLKKYLNEKKKLMLMLMELGGVEEIGMLEDHGCSPSPARIIDQHFLPKRTRKHSLIYKSLFYALSD